MECLGDFFVGCAVGYLAQHLVDEGRGDASLSLDHIGEHGNECGVAWRRVHPPRVYRHRKGQTSSTPIFRML